MDKTQNNPNQKIRKLNSIFNDLFFLFLCPPNCLYECLHYSLSQQQKETRINWIVDDLKTSNILPQDVTVDTRLFAMRSADQVRYWNFSTLRRLWYSVDITALEVLGNRLKTAVQQIGPIFQKDCKKPCSKFVQSFRRIVKMKISITYIVLKLNYLNVILFL